MVATVGGLAINFSTNVATFERDMGKASKAVRSTSARSNVALASMQKNFRSLSRDVKRTVASMVSLRGAFAAIVGGSALRAVITNFADFEKTMSEVKAVTSATQGQMMSMSTAARELGATTQFSAAQAAAGMAFLGRAGFDTNEILQTIRPSLDLAAASNIDLARSADIVSNVMQSFNARASESQRYVDVLANVTRNANTDMEQLAEAMKMVAPVAANMDISVEETAAAIGALSDAGLQATVAGTGLRRVLSELANPSEELKSMMQGMSIEADGFTAVMAKLAQQNITAGEALTLFGERGGPAFLVLQDGILKVAELTEKLQHSKGAAEEMARASQDNLTGAFKDLKSAASELAITIGQGVLGRGLRDLVEGMTHVIRVVGLAANAKMTFVEASGLLENATVAATKGIIIAWEGVSQAILSAAEISVRGVDFAARQLRRFANAIPGITISDDTGLDGMIKDLQMRRLNSVQRIAQYSGFDVTPIEDMRRKVEDLNKAVEGTGTAGRSASPAVQSLMDSMARAGNTSNATSRSLDKVTRSLNTYKDASSATRASVVSDLMSSAQAFTDWKSAAISAIQDVLRSLIQLSSGGSATGGLGGMLAPALMGFASQGSILSGVSNFSSRSSFQLATAAGSGAFGPGFATGGSFMVGGPAGRDKTPVSFMASRGEKVSIETSSQQRQSSSGGGNTYVIDARGADQGAVTRIEKALKELAGPGVVERRAMSAIRDRNRRDPSFMRP